MKIIVRGILQKLMKYWTIRQRDYRPSQAATQCIILEIDWFFIQFVTGCKLVWFTSLQSQIQRGILFLMRKIHILAIVPFSTSLSDWKVG